MDVLIILGSASDKSLIDEGIKILTKANISFSMRIASAHRSPDHLKEILDDFKAKRGAVVICVAGKSAHLAGVVASKVIEPVVAVPVYSSATAGFDSLLSVSQMPAGIPVATMGLGNSGFINACWYAIQTLALKDDNLKSFMIKERQEMAAKVKKDDSQFAL